MGTDMSKPKCKKLEKIGHLNKLYSKSMIYRDFDCPEPMIREFRNGAGPCMPCPGPGQFQGGTLQRIYFPNQCADMNPCSNRKSMPVLDACVDPCRSRCGSPCGGANSGGGGKPIYIATDCADTKSSCRQSRYRTMNTCRRDDEIYCDRRTGAFVAPSGVDPRHFTITKTYNQPIVYDDIDKNVRLPSEADLIPADRIYEIRKEKIMIKADRNSLSPLPHPRSKSSERYIDMPKSVRIIDEYRTDKSNMYDADNCDEANNSIRRQLKSRSGYLVNSDYEATSKSYLESYVDSNGTKLIADQPPQQTQYNMGSSSNGLSNSSNGYKTRLSTNDIIYVPMVKEEFIKRESKKSTDITDYRQTTIDPGTVGSADGWTTREKITNKIIIKEVCPLNEQQRQINNGYVNYETRRSPTENEAVNMIYQPKKSILKNTANVDVTSEYVNNVNGQRAYTTNCKNGVTITVCCPTDDQQQQQVIVGAAENPAAMDNKVVTEKKNVTYEKFYIVENMAPNGRLVNGGSSVAVNQAKRSNRMNDDSGDDEQDDDERRSKDLDEENRPKSVSYGIVKDGKFYNINDSA